MQIILLFLTEKKYNETTNELKELSSKYEKIQVEQVSCNFLFIFYNSVTIVNTMKLMGSKWLRG